jgi:uncharacterized protein YeaO (DUF488 family)
VSTVVSRNVRIKRVYDPPSPEDGLRILITRYWPRGIKREAVDEYDTKVAPSRELLREFKHEGLAWEPYTQRYLREMEAEESRRDIERLGEIASARTITLMCVCEDETHCHRSLLQDLIVRTMGRSHPTSTSDRRSHQRRAGAACRGRGGVPRSHLHPGRAGGPHNIAITGA